MNARELLKRKRIKEIQDVLVKKPDFDFEDLVSLLIVNFFISRRIAVEEINAVKKFLEMEGGDSNEKENRYEKCSKET